MASTSPATNSSWTARSSADGRGPVAPVRGVLDVPIGDHTPRAIIRSARVGQRYACYDAQYAGIGSDPLHSDCAAPAGLTVRPRPGDCAAPAGSPPAGPHRVRWTSAPHSRGTTIGIGDIGCAVTHRGT